MKLNDFYNELNHKSDKGTTHDYIDGYYSNEFSPKKDSKIELLEIGVQDGASIHLWDKYFTNATIIGLDINEYFVIECLSNSGYIHWLDLNDNQLKTRVKICDAYDDKYVNEFEDNRFDYIIDDGPHTVQSQITFIQKYLKKVKIGGKLIIEDIQSEYDLFLLTEEAKKTGMIYKVYDMRPNKGRYDDIILEITKN